MIVQPNVAAGARTGFVASHALHKVLLAISSYGNRRFEGGHSHSPWPPACTSMLAPRAVDLVRYGAMSRPDRTPMEPECPLSPRKQTEELNRRARAGSSLEFQEPSMHAALATDDRNGDADDGEVVVVLVVLVLVEK